MAQHLADLHQRGACSQDLSGRGVPQSVCSQLAQARSAPSCDHDLSHPGSGQGAVRRSDSHEHLAAFGAARTAATQVGGHGLADIGGQREPLLPVALAADDDRAYSPVDVVQLQASSLTGTQSESCQHREDREIAASDRGATVAAVQ